MTSGAVSNPELFHVVNHHVHNRETGWVSRNGSKMFTSALSEYARGFLNVKGLAATT